MLNRMSKYFLLFFIFFIKISLVNAENIKSISVNGNDRITNETIIIFSKINIGDDLIISDLNKMIILNITFFMFIKIF